MGAKGKLTTKDKITIVHVSPEIRTATAMLLAIMQDCKAIKSFIRLPFDYNGKEYELIFQKVKKTTHK